MTQSLQDLAQSTDALTFLNAIKVTLQEIKDELSTQDELDEYKNRSRERCKKLLKKVDAQYRLFARVVNRESSLATHVTVDNNIPDDFDEMKDLMEKT